MLIELLLFNLLPIINSQIYPQINSNHRCPRNWVLKNDEESYNKRDYICYKFVRSPKKSYFDANELCKSYGANLATINTNDEHGFIMMYLHTTDFSYRDWYIGVTQKSFGYWENDDGTPLLDVIQRQFLPDQTHSNSRNNLAYSFSQRRNEWGLKMLDGDMPREFICELHSNQMQDILMNMDENRDLEYGVEIKDPKYLPRGPKIIHQPEDAMFDLLKRDRDYRVEITCLADGYPFPTYEWFKEQYKANNLFSSKIDPLKDARLTLSGGTLVINKPKEIEDRGNYYCTAANKFGKVVSRRVQVAFAYMAEFNLKRSGESGNRNWGKAIYCDPPRFFPDARFYWSRDAFPNFVDEDKRTFVSFDGNLYYSYLDNIDEGTYQCTVQSTVSDIGRHGPKFMLKTLPYPNYQQLKFANNFPKAFPESPLRGDDVRLECIAFGYPVPNYNWTRVNGALPRRAKLLNYNRVLLLPKVEPADVGDYICQTQNGRSAIEAKVSLSIQATPTFLIPLSDIFVSEGEDVFAECEAFAIPDVSYSWLKNGVELDPITFSGVVNGRYTILDNTLKIKAVNLEDQGMYQCKATNQLGSTYSSAELRVLNIAPTFRKNPLDPEIFTAVGTNITLSCNPEAAPAPKYEWRKDGLRIGRGGRIDISESGDLYIQLVQREDRGDYTCIATNREGSSSTSGRLIVLDEPRFKYKLPEIIYASVGGNQHLKCEVWMDEMLDMIYIWTHNDLRIDVNPYRPYRDKFQDGDNFFSDFYSRRTEQVVDTRDENLKRQEEYFGFMSTRDPPYAGDFHHPGHLVIKNITLHDAGFYMCDARTPIANLSQVTEMIVYGPPGPSGGVVALSLTSTSATIRWTDGSENGQEIETYSVEGMTKFTNEWQPLVSDVKARVIDERSSRKEYVLPIGTLSPWASYEFRVRAKNVFGAGEFSEASPSANTQQDVPFKAPSRVFGGKGKTGDLTIRWTPLPPEDQNAPGIYYKVFWRRYENSTERNFEIFKQEVLRNKGNVGLFVAEVPLKFFYTLYEVKVQSANSKGWGPISKPELIYTAEDMPQVQPTEVKAFANNATSLNVTWRAIEPTRENIRGKLIGYRIRYWREVDNEALAQIRLIRSTKPFGQIVGLVPNTFYWVRVMAYNSAGSGPESEKFRERTWRFPPLTPPNAVEVTPVDPQTIYVTWRGITPTYSEEALMGYKVRIWESDQDMTTANETIVRLGSHLEAYISGLQVGKMYKLRVLAYSLGGEGKMSSPPWHFSMGDPRKLTADAQGFAVSFGLINFVAFLLLAKVYSTSRLQL